VTSVYFLHLLAVQLVNKEMPVIFSTAMKSFIPKTGRHSLMISTLLLLTSACGSNSQQEIPLTPVVTIHAYQHKNLQTIFTEYDYSWDQLDLGVPPLILKKFPDDLPEIDSVELKKELFFKSVLPMVLLANEEIREQRDTLKEIFLYFDQNGMIDARQQEELSAINRQYQIKTDPLLDHKTRQRLLRRVDILPESLVLAQAANESGWGTSRFALQANNIFGEWTFTPGTGLIPADRPEGEIYEVRRFMNLYQSVRSYMRNLNTHRAYLSLRKEREKLRQKSLTVSGLDLSPRLDNYSTRREAYSREIEELIRSNRLEQKVARAYLRSTVSIQEIDGTESGTGLFGSMDQLQNRFKSL